MDAPAPGKIISSDFRLERLLSQGGMGFVYVATQLSTGRERALKLMKPALVKDAAKRARFEQEAKIVARIKSDHIVDVIASGVDEESGIPFLAMELLEGEDLAATLKRRGPLPHADVKDVFEQLGHALTAAHDAGVVHRDLKPENIFLEKPRRRDDAVNVKVLDFGISKLLDGEAAARTAAIGTPHWMSPEQTDGKAGLTVAADIWPLGLIAFRVLTGRYYWRAANEKPISLVSILKEVAIEDIAPASERAAELGCTVQLPPGFDDWFARCVHRDPKARFADVSEAIEALSQVLTPAAEPAALPAAEPRPPPTPEPLRPEVVSPIPPAAPTIDDASVPEAKAAAIVASTRAPEVQTSRRMVWPWVLAACGVAAVLFVGLRRPSGAREETPAKPSATASVQSAAAANASSIETAAAQPPKRPETWVVPITSSPVKGPAEALVTIVEFANFQCPFSRSSQPSLQRVLAAHPNDVRVVWKDDPLAIHPRAEAAATLARLAFMKGGDKSFWAAHDALFANPPELTDSQLDDIAKAISLDPAAARTAIDARSHDAAIDRDIELGDGLMVGATPTFYINGRRLPGMQSFESLEAVVQEELARARAWVASGTRPADVYATLQKEARAPAEAERRKVDPPRLTSPVRGGGASRIATMQVFCDFQDELCASSATVVAHLLDRYKSRLAVVWRDAPQPAHADARLAASAAREAYRQKGPEGFTKMHDLLFANQKTEGGLARAALDRYASQAGLDLAAFKLALDGREHDTEIEEDTKAALAADLRSIPTFVIGDYVLRGVTPLKTLTKRIDAELSAP